MEDLATLGFAVDSTPLTESERAMDRMASAAVKVDTATRGVTEAQRALGTATATATSATEKQVDATRRATQYDEALAAAYRRATAQVTADAQARVAAIRNVEAAATTAARHEADAYAMARRQAEGYARAAQQSMIEATRASSRDLMASVAASTESIKAMYVGTAAAANSAATQIATANAKVAAAAGASTGYMGRPGQVGLNAQQRVMLGYQLQDVGVSLIGGMNPLVVAAQQGPQISMLYGGVGNMMRAIPKPLLYGGLATAAAGAGLYGLNSMAESQDDVREQERRFTTLLGSQREAVAAYQDIRKAAAETGVAVDVATAAFVSFARATQGLGASRAEIQSIATTVEKLTQIAGANDDESNAAGGAVADMLRKSVVGAEDLRRVLTNVPQIADQIAAGLGVSVTQLRLMAQEGTLTNRQVMDGLVQRAGAVNEEFARMPKSVGSTFSSMAADIGAVMKGLVDSIPIVNRYRDVLDAAAAAARKLREATAEETPQQTIARTTGAGAGMAPVGLGARGLSPGAAAGTMVAQRDFYTAQNDVAAQDVQKWATAVRAAAKAGDELVLSAAAIAEKFSSLTQQARASSQSIDTMEKALAALQTGATTFSAEEAARQIDILTRSLERAREQAANFDPALKSINDISRRNDWRANDPSAAGMALQSRVYDLTQSGANQQDAMTAALAEQQEKVADIVVLKQQEADASTRMLEAVRKGKVATIEAKVEAAVLAFVWANVGNNVEVSAEQIKAYGDAIRTTLKNEDLIGGVNASKQYTDQLAGIAAQMKVVEQGAYAMRRAEAEAMAARSDNGTGKLQLEVFDARQALTDATALADLQRSIDLTKALAAAAGNVAEQKRIQLEYDIKIAQLTAGPGAGAEIAEKMRADAAAKTNREISEGLADIQRQVDLSRQQLDIVRSGAPDMTAQLAMLQKRNELVARGIDLDSDAAKQQIELAGQKARIDEQVSIAKEAADSTKRIWQNAYDNIQTFGADTFYNIFSGAELNGQTVASSLKNIFLRAFAEIAAAAVIRPLISPLFQAAAGAGIGSSGALGAAAGTGSAGGLLGGLGSIGNIGGIGSIGSMANYGKQAWNWIGGLFGGGGAAASTAASAGGGSFANIGALLSSGQTGASAAATGASSGLLGAIPVWGWMAAAASIVKSFTGNAPKNQPLGIVDTLLGPSIDQWMSNPGRSAFTVLNPLGPLGMVLSDVLGLGIFGESAPKTQYSNTNANLRYGGNGWYTTGSAYGPNANSGQGESSLRNTTTGIDSIFDLMGGVQDASKVWGLNLSSWTAQGKDWAYTSQATHLVDPTNGNTTAWRMNMGDMMDTGAAQVAIRSILSGAVGEITDSMKTALEAMRASGTGMKEVAENIAFVTDTYDRLGKAAISIKPQFEEVTKRFEEMADTAKTLGLSLEPVAAEQKKQTERLGQDYIDNLIDPVAAQLRAWEDEKASILANVDYIKQHTDVVVDQARITEGLLRREADLKDQLYNGAISQLEDAIKRLTYGDLANITGAATLSGMKASFDATVAQARAGDISAYQRVASEGLAYTEANRGYYASGPEYEAIRQQILAIFSELQIRTTGGASASPSEDPAANAAMAANLNNTQQLQAMMRDLAEQLAESKRDQAETNDLLRRLLSRDAA